MVQHYNDIHLVCYEQSCLVERKKKLIETHYIHTHTKTQSAIIACTHWSTLYTYIYLLNKDKMFYMMVL